MSESDRGMLPGKWTTAKLDELLTAPVVYGILQPGPNVSHGVPYIRPTEIDEDVVQVDQLRRTTPTIAARYERSKVSTADIILSIVGTIGKVALVPSVIDGANITQSSARVRVNPQAVLPRFVAWALRSPLLRQQFDKARLGTAVPRLNIAHVRDLVIPVAPFPEQQRLVDVLDEVMSDLDAGVKALESVRAKLKQYRAAVLKAAVEGTLTAEWRKAHPDVEPARELLKRILAERRRRWEEGQLKKYKDAGKEPPKNWKAKYEEPAAPEAGKLPPLPEGWCWTTVDQLAAPEPHAITDGPFGSNLMTSHYTDTGPRVVRLQNIGEMCFVDERAHITQAHFEGLRKHSVKAGDIVIAALGEVLPRACVIPESLGPAIVKADCVRFRTHPANSASALCGFLNSLLTRARMSQVVHGVGRPRLNLGELKGIALPLAPAEEQEAIAAEIDDQLSVIDHLDSDIEAKLKSAQALRQSILKTAFEGKLVPQDPKDEPAGELLKRIAAERAERERLAKEAKKAAKSAKVRRPKRGQHMSAVGAG